MLLFKIKIKLYNYYNLVVTKITVILTIKTHHIMEKGIVNSWSLVAFAKSNGKMKLGTFVNKDTGETFKSCMFVDSDGKVSKVVNFSSNLGELTPAEIVNRKDELQVVELTSGTFKLCKSGSTWEDVDL